MDDLINLNVGGCLYTTTRSTLTRYPDSMLGAMFSGELDPSVRDANGAYVMDRDGPIFRHVLNFLRQGKLILPEDFKEWDLLASEADFFQIPDLVAAVSSRKGVEDNPKMEFVEFTEQDNKSCKYRGSWETLKQLPREFLAVFEADPSFPTCEYGKQLRSLEDMRSSVEMFGEISGYWGFTPVDNESTVRFTDSFGYYRVQLPDRSELNPPNWMAVFQRASELGFQLLSTSAVSTENKWLFGRKIPPKIVARDPP